MQAPLVTQGSMLTLEPNSRPCLNDSIRFVLDMPELLCPLQVWHLSIFFIVVLAAAAAAASLHFLTNSDSLLSTSCWREGRIGNLHCSRTWSTAVSTCSNVTTTPSNDSIGVPLVAAWHRRPRYLSKSVSLCSLRRRKSTSARVDRTFRISLTTDSANMHLVGYKTCQRLYLVFERLSSGLAIVY